MGRTFGTAGVRGVFNRSQTPEEVFVLVETIAFATGRGRYGIGWDGRKVSSLLARTAASAVASAGSDPLLFGEVPTPVVAYGTSTRSCKMGFAVTASHNPPEFSGVKVFNHKGMELSKSEEEGIERALAVGATRTTGRFGQTARERGVVDDYIELLISRHPRPVASLKIAVDCANGPGALVTPEVLTRLGHSVQPVNCQVSWRFPGRLPEPTQATLTDFCAIVPTLGVDVAMAHDGDADRLVLVDAQGRVVPDSILAILALRGVGATNGTVVISENTSNAVADEAERLGLRVVRSRVGKSFALLESEGGVFATEPSKIVDPAWGLWEDGINAAALVSGVLSADRDLLVRLMGTVQWRYRQLNPDGSARLLPLAEKAREMFRRFRIVEERALDGIKLIFEDGSWIMFRPSGTEPKTRIYCESKDQQRLDELAQLGAQCVESSL